MATLSLDDVLLAIGQQPMLGGLGNPYDAVNKARESAGVEALSLIPSIVGAFGTVALPFVAMERQRKEARKDRKSQELQQQRLLQFEAEQAEKRRKTQARLMDQLVAFGALALGGSVALWAMSGSSKRKTGRRR